MQNSMAASLNPNFTFYVVIPARYGSTRLPGKPLLDIAGKPMVVWVAERARLSGAKQVIVATDDTRIVKTVRQYGHQALKTRSDHVSGTDRIAEVAVNLNWADEDVVVNVQGDEPLIEVALITALVQKLNEVPEAVMATACHPIHNKTDFLNPNIVKVVLDAQANALYFSRAPIPYPRDYFSESVLPSVVPAYRHIGIYAYRTKFLKQYANLRPNAVEQCESLEQLRVLYHGYKITVAIVSNAPVAGVDTSEDLAQMRHIYSKLVALP